MKAKVNLTIDEQLLRKAKRYAAKEKTSLSELLAQYLQKLIRQPKQKSVIDIVENMKSPNIPGDKDLIQEYYKEIEKKYGA